MESSHRPVHEIRLGVVRATIWANPTRDRRTFFNVRFSRLYKDSEAWKETSSFGRDDLPVLGKVIDLAYAWIWMQTPVARGSEP